MLLNRNVIFDSITLHVVDGGAGAVLMSKRWWVRYKKAPILEAVLEFRWLQPNSLGTLRTVLESRAFDDFEEPRPRKRISAALDPNSGGVSQTSEDVGFEAAIKDGSERVFLEQDKFVFIQRAPYDRWEYFSKRALSLLGPVVQALGIGEFSRLGVRFVNRIDVPHSEDGGFNTEDYITIKFDGPRTDRGIVDEFQLRVVKPTMREGISYALVVVTAASPLANHSGIVLDIDVFTKTATPASGEIFEGTLAQMRQEKNDIFESCLTDRARALFGGVEE